MKILFFLGAFVACQLNCLGVAAPNFDCANDVLIALVKKSLISGILVVPGDLEKKVAIHSGYDTETLQTALQSLGMNLTKMPSGKFLVVSAGATELLKNRNFLSEELSHFSIKDAGLTQVSEALNAYGVLGVMISSISRDRQKRRISLDMKKESVLDLLTEISKQLGSNAYWNASIVDFGIKNANGSPKYFLNIMF